MEACKWLDKQGHQWRIEDLCDILAFADDKVVRWCFETGKFSLVPAPQRVGCSVSTLLMLLIMSDKVSRINWILSNNIWDWNVSHDVQMEYLGAALTTGRTDVASSVHLGGGAGNRDRAPCYPSPYHLEQAVYSNDIKTTRWILSTTNGISIGAELTDRYLHSAIKFNNIQMVALLCRFREHFNDLLKCHILKSGNIEITKLCLSPSERLSEDLRAYISSTLNWGEFYRVWDVHGQALNAMKWASTFFLLPSS
jgi:hypothetical protein